jgi:hypothetical protein
VECLLVPSKEYVEKWSSIGCRSGRCSVGPVGWIWTRSLIRMDFIAVSLILGIANFDFDCLVSKSTSASHQSCKLTDSNPFFGIRTKIERNQEYDDHPIAIISILVTVLFNIEGINFKLFQDSRFLRFDHRPSITDHRPLISDHRPLITDDRPLITE